MLPNSILKNSELLNHKYISEMATPQLFGANIPIHSISQCNPEEKQMVFQALERPNQHYKIDFDRLIGPNRLTLMQRYKMMKWLYSETNKLQVPREVFAFTCYYLDLYMQKLQLIKAQDLQLIALAALLVATKIEGNKYPQIGGEISKEGILQLEKDICFVLGFYLNPKTYVTVMDQILEQWDGFSLQKYNKEQFAYLSESPQAFLKNKILFQKMELINMVASSLRYNHYDLAFNLFFLQNKINIQGVDLTSKDSSFVLLFTKKAYEEKDGYSDIFQEFLVQCSKKDVFFPQLDTNIGIFLAQFIGLPVSKVPPNRKTANYQAYRRMQTVSSEAIGVLDKIIKTIK